MYYSLKAGMALASFVPPRLGYWLAWLVGTILYYGLSSHRRAVQANVRRVLGRGVKPGRLARVSRGVFRHSAKNYYDLLRLPRLKPSDIEKMITLIGMEHVEAAFKKGRGVLICGAHMANFNLMMQIPAAYNYKANIVAERLASAKLDGLVSGLRERFGIKVIHTGPHLVRGIYRALRANEMLGLAIDRDITQNGLAVDLFGSPAVLPAGPVMLSLRLGAPILPVRVRRERNNRTSVTVYPPLELERTGDNDRDLRAGIEKLARLLEEWVRDAPEQWVITQPIWAADGGPAAPSPGFAAFIRAHDGKADARPQPPALAENEPAVSPEVTPVKPTT